MKKGEWGWEWWKDAKVPILVEPDCWMWHKRITHAGPNRSKQITPKESQVEVNKCSHEDLKIKHCCSLSMQNKGKDVFKIIRRKPIEFTNSRQASEEFWRVFFMQKEMGPDRKMKIQEGIKSIKNGILVNLNDYWLYRRIMTMIELGSNSKNTWCRKQDKIEGTLKKDTPG